MHEKEEVNVVIEQFHHARTSQPHVVLGHRSLSHAKTYLTESLVLLILLAKLKLPRARDTIYVGDRLWQSLVVDDVVFCIVPSLPWLSVM